MKEEIEEFAGKMIPRKMFKGMAYYFLCLFTTGLFQWLLLKLFSNVPIALVGSGLIISAIINLNVEKDEREDRMWFTVLVIFVWGGFNGAITFQESNLNLALWIVLLTMILASGLATALMLIWFSSWKNMLVVSKKFPLIGILTSREVSFERGKHGRSKMNASTFRINNMIEILTNGKRKSVSLDQLDFIERGEECVVLNGKSPIITVAKDKLQGIKELIEEVKAIPLAPQS